MWGFLPLYYKIIGKTMFRDSGKIIVVDTELTCWENDTPPECEEREIIQIGWCLLDMHTLQRSGIGQILVKPVRSKISSYCTALTGITPKMARSGVPFDAACKNLMKCTASRRRAWASWGIGDRLAFERECALAGVEIPFCEAHLDIQMLLSLFLRFPVHTGQEASLSALGITEEGIAHRADVDAWNAAAVMALIVNKCRDGFGRRD